MPLSTKVKVYSGTAAISTNAILLVPSCFFISSIFVSNSFLFSIYPNCSPEILTLYANLYFKKITVMTITKAIATKIIHLKVSFV